MTRACPSRFSSSPYGCSLDGGWGPRETRPPAGSWARHPSLSLSFSPSLHLFLTPSLPSTAISPLPLHGSRNGGGGGTVHGAPLAPTPFQPSAPLYNILALCFSSLVILANDYEVRISVGPPGISGNVPEIGTRDSRRKSIRMDTVDSIGRFEWMIGARRGKWTG